MIGGHWLRSCLLGSRTKLGIVALLLLVALQGPLWFTRMESPQYHGEEALKVVVYAGQMRGDLREIQTLNKYIGVHLPERIPELRLAPWVLGLLLVIALAALVSPPAPRRIISVGLLVLMLGAMIAAMGLLGHRLEEFGHSRTHSIVARVPDFSPPVWGTAKIANFTVHAGLDYGAWAYLAAVFFVAWIVFFGNSRTPAPSLLRKQPVEDCGAAVISRR
jgi:hypothetical protein